MAAMKWWGWGAEAIEFTHVDKPALAPYIAEVIGLDVRTARVRAPLFEDLEPPAPRLPAQLQARLGDLLGVEHVSAEGLDRVAHARGKSVRDLVLQRRGTISRIPDAVVWPGSEDDVAGLMRLAVAEDLVLIPFGGGSSISGSLHVPETEARPALSVDLSRLNRVLELDRVSKLARVQAGVTGPELERQLGELGHTLGHLPDSFTYSTLGGWIATRSSGMQSDRYGDIADITKGLRAVTTLGTLVLRPLPASSTGPSVLQMMIGSEGRLGIVTEATVQVRPLPARRLILGYLFPTFSAGVEAAREISESEALVSVSRICDAAETRFSFATRTNPTLRDRLASWALGQYLRLRLGYDRTELALAFFGYEGSERHVAAQRRAVGRIVRAHRGLCIGAGPGALYDQKKFDTPYIRDYLLDRGVLADVSDTAMPWSRLSDVYDAVIAAANGAFERLGVRGHVMCHLSHSYLSGACLYFTFALVPSGAGDPLAEYDLVKSAIQQAFVDNGATLSHHHAVGTEHSFWLAQDISPVGVELLHALFDGTDPSRNLNPGKIVEP
jgi:alkyldihydroxyacetonephosphate synthase